MPDSTVTTKVRRAVAQRAGECCEYCQSQLRFSADPFVIEHIIPRSKGGTDELSNLAFSCQGCNNHKFVSTSAFDPVSGENVALFHPRQQSWNDHFIWNDDYSLIIGLTPTGRATVEKLRLNRRGIVNLRKVLQKINEHPPNRTN